MNRAAARRRGKRKEAAKRELKAKDLMWRRLSATEHKHPVGYKGSSKIESGFFYAPYIPLAVRGRYVVTDTTA